MFLVGRVARPVYFRTGLETLSYNSYFSEGANVKRLASRDHWPLARCPRGSTDRVRYSDR